MRGGEVAQEGREGVSEAGGSTGGSGDGLSYRPAPHPFILRVAGP